MNRVILILPAVATCLCLACGSDPAAPDGLNGASDASMDVSLQDLPARIPPGPACPVLESPELVDGRFTLPPNTVGLLLSGSAGPGPRTSWLLQGPSGPPLVPEGWFDSAAYPVCTACKNRVGVDSAQHAVLVPNAPAAESAVVAGVWRYRQQALDTGVVVPATALVKRAETLPLTGRVRLAIHVATQDLEAEKIRLAPALEELSVLYAPVGLTILDVSFHALPIEFAHVTVETFDRLFAHRVGSPEAIPVYLIETLTDAQGADLAGLSPTPGPFGPGGMAGPVIELDTPQLGRVLAHEMGHFLGLWHPFESFAMGIKDPLPDTPTFGAENLMTTGIPGTDLSAQQGEVMRRHPAVTHACTPVVD